MNNHKSKQMNQVISKDTISRLVKDITYIHKNPLISDGIYYNHHEIDMLTGYAMILGPSDTPYFGGYYLFKFEFPTDYPYSPPKLVYQTNDGYTRFNPNLYINGKVCVSILNTWHGEKWSSCQTIHSILLTLCTLLNKTPLLNEPGVNINNPDIEKYNTIITFKNISVAVCDFLNKKYVTPASEIFYPIMKDLFLNNYDKLLAIVDENIQKKNTDINVSIQLYHLFNVFIDYKSLKVKLMECKSNLLKDELHELRNNEKS
jgi:ubiquitin-conjugating enzyme E2 Z